MFAPFFSFLSKFSGSKLSGPSKLAAGILVVCWLCLILGIAQVIQNQVELARQEAQQPKAQAESAGKAFGKVFRSMAFEKDHLVELTLSGEINGEPPNQSFMSSISSASDVREALDELKDDKSVWGVLLRIDSPGGTVGASQELYEAINRLKVKKPVVISMGDLAASGGYYAAAAGDHIVANPGTLTGSIGVIMHSMNVKGLLQDKLGLRELTIKSGKFKDILSPYRDAVPEELAMLQRLINTSYEQFYSAVVAGRQAAKGYKADSTEGKALAQSIRAVADGRILIAPDALKAGLVDQLGDGHAAWQALNGLVHKRFPDKFDASVSLPLTGYNAPNRLFDLFGIDSQARHNAGLNTLFGSLLGPLTLSNRLEAGSMLPAARRFPTNQLLWMYE